MAASKGFRMKVGKDMSISFDMEEQDKKTLVADFGAQVHKARQMLDWFDDRGDSEKVQQKLEYFSHLYWSIKGLALALDLMLASEIKEKDIIEHLELPF